MKDLYPKMGYDVSYAANRAMDYLSSVVHIVDKSKCYNDLLRLYETAHELSMTVRKSRHMYIWDQRGSLGLPSTAWKEYPDYFDPNNVDERGDCQSRILFGPLVKKVDGQWKVIHTGSVLMPSDVR